MDPDQQKRLEAAGWAVGEASDFLDAPIHSPWATNDYGRSEWRWCCDWHKRRLAPEEPE